MEIKCLASGSTGNCYLVQMGSGCMMLDAGIPISKIQKEVNLNDVDVVFISHDHNDHSKSIENLAYRGLEIIQGNLIIDFHKIASMGLKQGEFQVFCFPVEHGEEKNGGIIIYNNINKECLLYITDFNLCRYDLDAFLNSYIPNARITDIMIECNYCDDLIVDLDDVKVKRQINTHMSLNGLQVFLDKLNLSKCKQIILMHVSQTLGDSIIMPATIYSRYKIKTGICRQWGGIEYYG